MLGRRSRDKHLYRLKVDRFDHNASRSLFHLVVPADSILKSVFFYKSSNLLEIKDVTIRFMWGTDIIREYKGCESNVSNKLELYLAEDKMISCLILSSKPDVCEFFYK